MSAPAASGALLSRILSGDAPRNVRLAAARGALPLSRTDLARLFVVLLEDGDPEVRETASASLAELGRESARDVLADPDCAPEVLRHFAPRAARDADLAEALVFNRGLPDDALDRLAGEGSAPVVELVLTNQERLLERPALLDRLCANPALRPDQRGRILEFLGRVSRALDVPGEDPAEVVDEPDAIDPEEAARILDVDVGELFAASEILDGEEFEQAEDPEIRSAYRKIVTLNTAQKAILAMKGSREERMILVRDTNKVVALSVLKNPRLNENDVESIAMMRNVSDEVLRQIGISREWTKRYAVVRLLVHNPRTPPGVATNFVPRLQNRDLKNLERDHNVPELMRRMAKRTLATRTQRRGVGRP